MVQRFFSRKLSLCIALTCLTLSLSNEFASAQAGSKPVVLFKAVKATGPKTVPPTTFIQFKDPIKKLSGSDELVFTIKGKKYFLRAISQEVVQRSASSSRNVINSDVADVESRTLKGKASFGLTKNGKKLVIASIMLNDGYYSLTKVKRSPLFKLNRLPTITFTKEPADLEISQSLSELKVPCAYTGVKTAKSRRLTLVTRFHTGDSWGKWRNDNIAESGISADKEFIAGGNAGETKQYLCRLIDFRTGATVGESRTGTVLYLVKAGEPGPGPGPGPNTGPGTTATPGGPGTTPNPGPTNTPTPLPHSGTWQNRLNPLDVNADGKVSGIDILNIINYTNIYGDPVAFPAYGSPPPYYDVNGDGKISTLDVTLIIDHLNGVPPRISVLHSVAIAGTNVEVTYSKNFNTCLALYTKDKKPTHDGVIFCKVGVQVRDTFPLSTFTNITVGTQVLMREDNGNTRSEPVAVTNASINQECLTRCSKAASKYRVTVMGPTTGVYGEQFSGLGINNSGGTVGPFWPEWIDLGSLRTSSFTIGALHRYFYSETLDNSVKAAAIRLAGDYVHATDISDNGLITGRYSTLRPNETLTGFIYNTATGQETIIPKLRSLGTSVEMYPSSINNQGQVAGHNIIANNSGLPCGAYSWEAFIYENGVARSIDTGSQNSRAFGNNNLGQVVGQAETGCKSGIHKPFLYSADKGMQYLRALDTNFYVGNGAYAINDKGYIVGGNGGKALQWCGADAEPQNLGELRAYGGAEARAINASGLVVGGAVGTDGQMAAAVFNYCPSQGINGIAQRLDTLLVAGSDQWKFYEAYSINDIGEIMVAGINLSRSSDPTNGPYVVKLVPE